MNPITCGPASLILSALCGDGLSADSVKRFARELGACYEYVQPDRPDSK